MIARIVGALAILAMVATAITLARYESARDAWRAHAAIDTPGYDAAASDAAYASVADALVWVERSARVAAASILVVGIAIGRTRRTEIERRALASVIDVIALLAAFAITRVRVSSPGVTLVIVWCGTAMWLAIVVGAFASGASLGARLIPSRTPPA